MNQIAAYLQAAVVVAKAAVEVESAKRFVVPPAAPAIERLAYGEVVPIPTLPLASIVMRVVPFVSRWSFVLSMTASWLSPLACTPILKPLGAVALVNRP